MDSGLEVMIFMGLILKIPVGAAAWLIWHAVRAEPDPAEDEGGTDRDHFRREPKRPHSPRRGPHAPGALELPWPEDAGRLRVVRRSARTRQPERIREHQG